MGLHPVIDAPPDDPVRLPVPARIKDIIRLAAPYEAVPDRIPVRDEQGLEGKVPSGDGRRQEIGRAQDRARDGIHGAVTAADPELGRRRQ